MKIITPTRAGIAALSAFVIGVSVACGPVETTADPNLTGSAKPTGTTKAGARAGASKTALPKGQHEITYKVGGTATRASLTYTTPSGQEQHTKSVPWKKTLRAPAGEFLSVSAQNEGGGTITCEIWVDGKKLKSGKSSGAYAIASCDALLGW